jgi:SAM-dependent methyltransferase
MALQQIAAPLQDIVEGRVVRAAPPLWCEERGWSEFLLSLDDRELLACEAEGLAAMLPRLARAPCTLAELGRAIVAAGDVPRLQHAPALDQRRLRSVRLRKRAQLASLLEAVRRMAAHSERIVDVGSGSGHFTRLSAELFQRHALGLERSAVRVDSARQRFGSGGSSLVSFVAGDARRLLELCELDLAVGLHACGELGDLLVLAAARSRCDVALVSCCLQKITETRRRPLSSSLRLELCREHLGLTNLTAQAQGVEDSIERTLAARQTRFALARLLAARGLELEPGSEMSGINRRRASAGLEHLAHSALAQRGLAPPTPQEISYHEQRAAGEFAIVRRLSLPRNMLSRLLELLVVCDRGAALEEHGLQVELAQVFEPAISPRNLGLFASRRAARLPEIRAAKCLDGGEISAPTRLDQSSALYSRRCR